MRPLLSVLALVGLLTSCTQPNRTLQVLEAEEEPEPRDTAEDIDPLSPDTNAHGCIYAEETLADPLPVDFCVSVSPELGVRCTQENLVGQLALTGDATDPTLAYCDYDIGGGTRAVTWDAASESLERSMLLSDVCSADAHDGGTVEGPTGDLVTVVQEWSDAVGGYSLTSLGFGETGIWTAQSGIAEWGVQVAEAPGGAMVLARSGASTLHARPLDLSTGAIGEAVVVATGVRQLASTMHDGDLFSVVCTSDEARIVRVGTESADTVQSFEGACPNPAISSSGSRLALVLREGTSESMVLLDEQFEEVTRVALTEGEGQINALAWTGSAFVSVNHLGQVHTWTEDGDQVMVGAYPFLPHPAGTIRAMRLRASENHLAIAVTLDLTEVTPGGHVNRKEGVTLGVVRLP